MSFSSVNRMLRGLAFFLAKFGGISSHTIPPWYSRKKQTSSVLPVLLNLVSVSWYSTEESVVLQFPVNSEQIYDHLHKTILAYPFSVPS